MHSENDSPAGLPSYGIAIPTVDFHEPSGTYRTEFDVHTRPASEAIIKAVATATGNDQLGLPSLYSAIDTDALDAIFDSPIRDTSKQGLTVAFEYADCRVSAKAHGTVVVEPDREGGRTER